MTDPARLNDGSTAPPRLRIGLNHQTFANLPDWSCGPGPDPVAAMRAARAAGYEAVQSHLEPLLAAALDAGLVATALARIDAPDDARRIARRGRAWGCDCTTLHVGTGFESDAEALALLEAVLEASAAEGHPMLVETHRATVTESMKRTLDFVAILPDLRFNGDFSHWYTGGEMTYGDLDAKLRRLSPVLARTRFLHGRVSTPGCIQVPTSDGRFGDHLQVFHRLWREVFEGFLATAGSGDLVAFYPELLPPNLHYARLIPDGNGGWREESDRWLEALALVADAKEAWRAATAKRAG